MRNGLIFSLYFYPVHPAILFFYPSSLGVARCSRCLIFPVHSTEISVVAKALEDVGDEAED
jgi:hypothetical protein